MKVPFVDLGALHREVRPEIETAFAGILDRSAFIGGEPVARFERDFAEYCRRQFCVSCASGTEALRLALMAVGVQRGSEVLTVPNTFIATVEAITAIGAHPVFIDIDGPTYNLSPRKLFEFLDGQCRRRADGRMVNRETGRAVTAMVPVHLYGLMADMQPLMQLAREYNLRVVEDACQAHGAEYEFEGETKRAGSVGDAAAFSFYPAKNLGAMGEGGAAMTGSQEMDRMMRIWRDHGSTEKYLHVSPDGWNARLDAMQAAILDIKLKKLDEWNEKRRRAAEWYRERLSGDERIVLPVESPGQRHVYHLYVVRLPDREASRRHLSEREIGVGLHYPVPLHLQEAYRDMGWRRGEYPETEAAAASILSLPMFPHLTEEQVDFVCETLKESLERR